MRVARELINQLFGKKLSKKRTFQNVKILIFLDFRSLLSDEKNLAGRVYGLQTTAAHPNIMFKPVLITPEKHFVLSETLKTHQNQPKQPPAKSYTPNHDFGGLRKVRKKIAIF